MNSITFLIVAATVIASTSYGSGTEVYSGTSNGKACTVSVNFDNDDFINDIKVQGTYEWYNAPVIKNHLLKGFYRGIVSTNLVIAAFDPNDNVNSYRDDLEEIHEHSDISGDGKLQQADGTLSIKPQYYTTRTIIDREVKIGDVNEDRKETLVAYGESEAIKRVTIRYRYQDRKIVCDNLQRQ